MKLEIKLEVELPEDEVKIKGDLARIKQIIINLIGNAIKFTDAGQVIVKVLIHGQTSDYMQIEIRVTDTGIGLDAEQIRSIFDRFTLANAIIGNQYGGSGLGLLIAKKLSNLMGGDIKIESRKKEGSTFSCMIRCDNLNEEEKYLLSKGEIGKEKSMMVIPQSKTSVLSPNQFTVLIVDDNQINRTTLGHFMQQEKYECQFAVDGQEAVNMYKNSCKNTQTIDIVLMDVMMPIMDGIDATKGIRQYEEYKQLRHIPIIGVSANAVPILPLSYQTFFIQAVHFCLVKCQKKLNSNTEAYKFIDNLIIYVLSPKGADDVFRKIAAILNSSEYSKYKVEVWPLRNKFIMYMHDYNENRLAMNVPNKNLPTLAKTAPILPLSHQELFIHSVNFLLFRWANTYKKNLKSIILLMA